MFDNYDLKILRQLMEQARTTWAELGAILGLSSPAAAERVRKLEERGVIKGYIAQVDPESIGYGLAAFIAVYLDRPKHRSGFLQTIQVMPEVQECHHIAGDEDYILKVRCRNTRDLERIVSDEIKAIDGVVKTRTTIILATMKETLVLPVPERER